MEFSTEIIVAIIVGIFSFGGSLLLYLKGAKKDEVEALSGIITKLREYVENLEADKEDLQAWAEKLVCQVKDAGLEPAKFIRSPRAIPK